MSLLRPQPIGIFRLPAGLLLLPSSDESCAEAAAAALLDGRLPEEWPGPWEFVAHAIADDREAALEALRHDGSALSAFNRFVLGGAPEDEAHAIASGDAVVIAMAGLAAYAMGARDTLPAFDALDGELRAWALLVRAAQALEGHDPEAAVTALEEARSLARATSPLLAAQVAGQLADLQPEDALEARLGLLRDAARLAGAGGLDALAADLQLRLALMLQEHAATNRHRLVEAVNAYQTVLRRGITAETAPETFALVQNNLGLAYAAMPMTAAGDKLRLGVAVQSFREALKVYTREAHPDAWASTMLNMANALQYLPSSHPQENLIEAVNAYEALLEVRNKAFDPVGYARLLANQANALAHLGMFAPALEKFNEAHKLLHWHGEPQAAAEILLQVERVNGQIATVGAQPGEG